MSDIEGVPVEPIERLAFTVEEAAKSVGVSPGTIRMWTRAHALPVFKVVGTTRIAKQALRDWLTENESVLSTSA